MSMIATSGSEIETFIIWLRDELQRTHYGEVGLVFTVHGDKVCKAKKINEKVYKVDNKR